MHEEMKGRQGARLIIPLESTPITKVCTGD